MKQLILFLCLTFSIGLLGQVDFPITFEDESIDYDFDDFGGNATTIIVDPTDATNKVAQSIRTANAEFFAGTSVGNSGFVNPIPFTETMTGITVRVWSPLAGISVKLKVEKNDDPTISVETDAMTTVAMQWETLTFDLSNQSPGTAALNLASVYDKLSIFFNFGAEGAEEQIYYWDDVLFTEIIGPVLPDLPITFEIDTLDYNLVDFGGNASTIIEDPTDATNTVAQSIRMADAATFAGTTAGGEGLANPVPFTNTATTMTVRVWSPLAGITVKLKAEDANNGAISVETDAVTTVAMQWDTLTFDFSNESENTPALSLVNTYDKISIFFNFGAEGVGEQIYFWDDVTFIEVVGPILPELPITFEDDMLDYSLDDFGGNATTIIPDPTDATNTVAQSIRTAEAEFFAGTSVANNGLANPIPFTPEATMMTVRVWSPVAGVTIKLKAENAAAPEISVETDATTTVAMQWEILTFDFSNESAGTAPLNLANLYNKVSIFFNFDATGVGEQIYFWDDVEFVEVGPAPRPELPITFEDDMLDYSFDDFGGNATTIIVDPTDATNTVAQSIRTANAEFFAGTSVANNGLANPIPFTEMVTTMSVRVWSPVAGIPVKLKVEKNDDPTISVETDVMTTVAMQWETLVFDFSNESVGTAALNLASTYDKISIFFNFGAEGIGEQIYFWDDVEFGTMVGTEVLPAGAYGIKVAPNPTNDLAVVTLPETITEQATLNLHNSNGQLVQTSVLSPGQTTVSLAQLPTGMYVLSIHTAAAIYVQKVLKL